MSSTIEYTDKFHLAADICEAIRSQGNVCFFNLRTDVIDSIELSVSTFRSFDLQVCKELAKRYKIQITSWACYGEFRADRIFTVSLSLVQTRSNGHE